MTGDGGGHFDPWEKSLAHCEDKTPAPMIYLLLAILGSGVIPVIFRAFAGWRVNLFWAIPINYVTCVSIGSFFAGNGLDLGNLLGQPWIWLAGVQGFFWR